MKKRLFENLILRDEILGEKLSMFAKSFKDDLANDFSEASVQEYIHLSNEFRLCSDLINHCHSISDLTFVLETEPTIVAFDSYQMALCD